MRSELIFILGKNQIDINEKFTNIKLYLIHFQEIMVVKEYHLLCSASFHLKEWIKMFLVPF